jgi:hypothetical protein
VTPCSRPGRSRPFTSITVCRLEARLSTTTRGGTWMARIRPGSRLLAAHPSLTSRYPNEAGRGGFAPHFRLLKLRGSDRSVKRGAQFLSGFECQFDTGTRSGV